jgi:hypothetical protein
VTFRHVVTALPIIAAAAVWFGSVVIGGAERAAASHIQQSKQASDDFMGEVRADLVRLRAEISDLKTQAEVDGATMVSRIDKLTDLLLTGRIKVRAVRPPPTEEDEP